MSLLPQVNIVVPLYNEEDSFDILQKRLTNVMDTSTLRVTVILVDDGSSDDTPSLMEALSLKDKRFTSIFLSRNFGHQLALSAGFSVVNATDAILIIDGDLQDPPELLDQFYDKYKEGYDVVYAIRTKRKEHFIKKYAYSLFYRLLRRISYIDFPLDSGDFSLISRKILNHINEMKEESRFIRGMRSWLGYKQIGIPYERQKRALGDSKYSFRKLLKLALNGIFNFSEVPIKFVTSIGLYTIIISLIYVTYTLFKLLFWDEVPEGFTGLIITITLFGGVQLLSIGILGEYILRIFFQVKDRPLFIIKKQIENGEAIL